MSKSNHDSQIKSLSTFITDKFLYLVIIVLGIVGCVYSFKLVNDTHPYKKHQLILSKKDLSQDDIMKYNFTKPLNIKGEMVVGNDVVMEVDSYLQTEPLFINTGNGQIERLVGEKTLEVHYDLPGEYGVELFTVQDKEKVVLSTQQIHIKSDFTKLSSASK